MCLKGAKWCKKMQNQQPSSEQEKVQRSLRRNKRFEVRGQLKKVEDMIWTYKENLQK